MPVSWLEYHSALDAKPAFVDVMKHGYNAFAEPRILHQFDTSSVALPAPSALPLPRQTTYVARMSCVARMSWPQLPNHKCGQMKISQFYIS